MMPFGPRNTSTLYSVTMKDLEAEWNIIFEQDKTVDLLNPYELVSRKSHPKPHPVKSYIAVRLL